MQEKNISRFRTSIVFIFILLICSCSLFGTNESNKSKEFNNQITAAVDPLSVQVIQTSKDGKKLAVVANLTLSAADPNPTASLITLSPGNTYQQIEGIGGAITESAAYVLNKLSVANRSAVIHAYFSDTGAAYSLVRTHINSCDFSVSSYSYDDTPGDYNLNNFNIQPDMGDLIPLIKDAMAAPGASFKILSSPWSPPAWMKTNGSMLNGGNLKTDCYAAWALYFSKYIKAYASQGIPIWAVTVQNEPAAAQSWESCIYTGQTEATFVANYLGPRFKADGITAKILAYDHNKDGLQSWLNNAYSNSTAYSYLWGSAVHWYASTVDTYNSTLDAIHNSYPGKAILHTEACVDNDVPGTTDSWYWGANATDWGYNQPGHPAYVPVFRYANDIIQDLNHWVVGWIDWNIALNTQGGPNHLNNWCNAPVIINESSATVYYTPLYYVMAHFSKYIRPGSYRIGVNNQNSQLSVTAVKNPSTGLQANTTVVEILNSTNNSISYKIEINGMYAAVTIPGNALQTVVIGEVPAPTATKTPLATPTRTATPAVTTIALKSRANGLFVCAENGGANALIANRAAASTWEKFEVTTNSDGSISLKSQANGMYVCAENGGASSLIARSSAIGTWEKFDLIYNSDGSIALRSKANGLYVCAENGGANALIANRAAVNTWESFDKVNQ